ncbi:MAG: GNAT family N-acetyltransferase [Candidatus Riflebacteria bacterium]|nr:GNAT family N-acetyltransferase [Candidatus Riflebacteria bacterium]
MQTELKIPAQALFLRKFVPEDADKVFKMSIENSMRKWIPDQVYRDVTHAQEVLAFLIDQYQEDVSPATAPVVLGVCLAETGELIGHVGISPIEDEVEVGYAIEEKHQGKGYATMALRAMCDWALTEFALPHILGIVATENHASCRVLEKAGFRLLCEEIGKMHGKDCLRRKYEFHSAAQR